VEEGGKEFFFFGGGIKIILFGGDGCLRYYAYHKMTTAKVVFVRFSGQSEN